VDGISQIWPFVMAFPRLETFAMAKILANKKWKERIIDGPK